MDRATVDNQKHQLAMAWISRPRSYKTSKGYLQMLPEECCRACLKDMHRSDAQSAAGEVCQGLPRLSRGWRATPCPRPAGDRLSLYSIA